MVVDYERNYSLGYRYLAEYAKHMDDGEAFYELGLLCELGLGTQQDFSNALSWYKKSIKANYAKAVDHIATMFRYGKIKGDSNMEKCIICKAYSKVISHISSQVRWNELRKENPQLVMDFLKLRFYTSSSFMDDFMDDMYLELQQYYINVLKNDGINLELADDVMNGINEQHRIEKVISLHWSGFESRIRDDFSKIMNSLSPEDISISYELDSYGKGIEAVDLGLPSGALWGSINVYEEQITPFGSQFAWAESKSKVSFTWKNYFDIYDDNKNEFEHLNVGHGLILNDIDAAENNFGDYWTIPTRGLIQELIDECHWEWICEKGRIGYNVVGKNGNKMFLPVINSDNKYGGYWSFSINKKDSRYADFLFFDKEHVKIKAAQRYLGLMIRPVAIINNMGDGLLGKSHHYKDFLEL